jgi:hypothetical protein
LIDFALLEEEVLEVQVKITSQMFYQVVQEVLD